MVSVTMNAQSRSAVRLALYNTLGVEMNVAFDGVMEQGTRRISTNVAGLPAGLYLLRLTGDGISETRSIIVTR
ncbi:MAG: Por secretion system C-terminal sorting protein [Chlorobi bacterium]|nr:Por secretion system C-terminal sorting protein [Chlorobiota bacterium]